MIHTNEAFDVQAQREPVRLPYTPPTLVEYGDINVVTQDFSPEASTIVALTVV